MIYVTAYAYSSFGSATAVFSQASLSKDILAFRSIGVSPSIDLHSYRYSIFAEMFFLIFSAIRSNHSKFLGWINKLKYNSISNIHDSSAVCVNCCVHQKLRNSFGDVEFVDKRLQSKWQPFYQFICFDIKWGMARRNMDQKGSKQFMRISIA